MAKNNSHRIPIWDEDFKNTVCFHSIHLILQICNLSIPQGFFSDDFFEMKCKYLADSWIREVNLLIYLFLNSKSTNFNGDFIYSPILNLQKVTAGATNSSKIASLECVGTIANSVIFSLCL